MNGKRAHFLLIISVLLAITLACSLGVGQAVKPTVVITFPQPDTNLIVGQELIVQSVAVDAKGVTRIEFLVNGQPVDGQTVNPPSTSYTANQPWAPEVPGRYVLQMQAYNLDDEPSEPAQVVVTVVERIAGPAAAGSTTPVTAVTGSVTPVPGTISEQTGGSPLVTALVDLNVRAGPGVEYPAVGALLAGQSAPIVGKNAGGTWWQVVYKPDATPGWVSGSAKYSTSANFEGVPVVEAPPPPTATPTPTDTPTSTPTATATPTPRRVVTYGLTADKDIILPGESVVLRWNLREIETAYLLYNGLEEEVVVPGNKTFYPTKTTTYTLVTRDEAGEETVIAQLTLKVIDATATPIPVLRDGKTRIVDGQMIDFDQGIIYQGEGAGIDFYWDGKSKKFVPENGSAVALLDLPFDEITLTECRFASYRERVPETNDSPAEVTGCYLTGEGRYGKFVVSELDSAGNLTIQWLTWDYR